MENPRERRLARLWGPVPARVLAVCGALIGSAILWGTLSGGPVSTAFGAPSALDCRYVAITSPAANATVSGAVEIMGRALVLDFQFYKVEYSPAGQDEWVLVGTDVVRSSVSNGRLVVWQTSRVPDGTYQLRLHVVDPTGNYCEAKVSAVRVSNARRVEAPPPTLTETVDLTVVPPQPTPTSPAVIATEVAPRSNTPGALPTRSQPFALPASDLLVVGAFFFMGVCGMSGLALAAGVVLFVRNHRS